MRDLIQTLACVHDANIEIGEDPGPPTPWRCRAKLYIAFAWGITAIVAISAYFGILWFFGAH